MSKPAFQLGTAKVLSSEPLETSDAKWLGLRALKWKDEEGKERKWEWSVDICIGNDVN